jgi:hypothetical protein
MAIDCRTTSETAPANRAAPGCPQESNRESADKKPYEYVPGVHSKLDAFIDQHAAAYGTIWSPHLLGPAFISFEEFIKTPELMALCPVGSDARFVLEELWKLSCFGGPRNESRRALTDYIRDSALYERHNSYRYVQRIFNSIWRNYQGLLEAKAANLNALIGARNNLLRADERRTKDAARKAQARSHDPRAVQERSAANAQTLRARAAKLLAQAQQKERKAMRWRSQADEMKSEAALLEGRANAASGTSGGHDATL